MYREGFKIIREAAMKISISVQDTDFSFTLPEIDIPKKYISVLREGSKIAGVVAEAIMNIQSDTEEQ